MSSEAVDVLGDGEGEELGENPTVTPGLNSTKQTEIRQHLATKKLLRTHLSHALDGLTLLLSTSTSPWIFSTPKPTSLDCLLLSHLSLLTLPNLPSPLIPGTIITSYPSITDYTRKSVAAAFGTEGSTINDAFGEKLEVHGEGEEDEEVLEQYENMRIGEGDTGKLPWRRPRGRNLGEVVGGVAGRALGALKGVVVA